MLGYLELLRERNRDLEARLHEYLAALKDLAEALGGAAYLFGSAARGEAIAASDVDVLIEVPDHADPLQVMLIARRLAPNRKIEIHVLRHSEAETLKRLAKTLVRL